MATHLEYFLQKLALAQPSMPKMQMGGTQGTAAVVPSFPPMSSANMGLGTPPPAPDFMSPKSLNQPVQAGGGVSSSSASKAAPAAPSTSNKTSAINSVADFKASVRGPLGPTRKSHQGTPTEESITQWSNPAAVEGGDGLSRLEAHVGDPGTKLSALLGTAARHGGKAAVKKGLKSGIGSKIKSMLGVRPRKATAFDVGSTAAFTTPGHGWSMLQPPKAQLGKADVAMRGNAYKPTRLNSPSYSKSRWQKFRS